MFCRLVVLVAFVFSSLGMENKKVSSVEEDDPEVVSICWERYVECLLDDARSDSGSSDDEEGEDWQSLVEYMREHPAD